MITLPSKANVPERKFPVSRLATYTAAYPPGKWAFVQASVRKALFDMNCYEPLSNRSHELILNPIRLANLVNQAFSSVGVEQSEKEQGKPTKSKSGGSTTLYVIVGMIALAVIAIAIFIFSKWSVISAGLGIE